MHEAGGSPFCLLLCMSMTITICGMSSLPLGVILFLAGMLTILLPCILPLLPIVVGVSIAGRSPWRPFFTVLGMVVSFVSFTFLLNLVLSQFVELADIIRLSTYYALVLFGTGFLTSNRTLQLLGAVLGGFFFQRYGWITVTIVQTVGATLMELGTKIASRVQSFGSAVQKKAGDKLGREHPLGAFCIGLTMGLVWAPCAGPALGFVLTLVRDAPGLKAFLLLLMYALGTAVPLMLIGYGGQSVIRFFRSLQHYSGRIKQVSGVLLIFTGIALYAGWFQDVQTTLIEHSAFGTLGTDIEKQLFPSMGNGGRE